jgi:hypothetical protein
MATKNSSGNQPRNVTPDEPGARMSAEALGAFVLGLLEMHRAGSVSEREFIVAVRKAKAGEPLPERFAGIAAAAIETAGGAS